MDETSLIYLITALVTALGIKEIWTIWKKKIDLKNKRANQDESTKDQITFQVIEELKAKIGELEAKIEELIELNQKCAVKLARLEERITLSAKKNAGRKRKTTKQ